MYSKFEKSVSLLTWGYNEEPLLVSFLDRAFKILDECVMDFEVIYVDDGSTDNSIRLLNEYVLREKRLTVIRHSKNLNVGIACRSAISAASKEILFWETVDFSYDIKNLRLYLELLSYYDVVQGIRPNSNYISSFFDKKLIISRSDNFQKAIVSYGNYFIIRLLFGIKFSDFQNVTFYPTKLIKSVIINSTTSFVNPECLLKTYSKGVTYIEVPIRFIPRALGEAKGTKVKAIILSISDIFCSWLKWGILFRINKFKYNSAVYNYKQKKLPIKVIKIISQFN